MSHQPLLTISQVATTLSVSQARGYEILKKGLIPVVRIGRQVRVREKDLDSYIESGGIGMRSIGGRRHAEART